MDYRMDYRDEYLESNIIAIKQALSKLTTYASKAAEQNSEQRTYYLIKVDNLLQAMIALKWGNEIIDDGKSDDTITNHNKLLNNENR
jgi:hypothetical protein